MIHEYPIVEFAALCSLDSNNVREHEICSLEIELELLLLKS